MLRLRISILFYADSDLALFRLSVSYYTRGNGGWGSNPKRKKEKKCQWTWFTLVIVGKQMLEKLCKMSRDSLHQPNPSVNRLLLFPLTFVPKIMQICQIKKKMESLTDARGGEYQRLNFVLPPPPPDLSLPSFSQKKLTFLQYFMIPGAGGGGNKTQ